MDLNVKWHANLTGKFLNFRNQLRFVKHWYLVNQFLATHIMATKHTQKYLYSIISYFVDYMYSIKP